MPYQEETIKTIIDRLNTQYFLPSIQRKYVWDHRRVVLLFDSIMRGYPISSFLFWELTQDNRDKWEIYKFCEKAYADNQGTDHIKHESAVGIQSMTLVLDGQQRLTSLLVGLKGTFAVRRPRQHFIRSQYPVYKLYVDLFADPSPIDDDGEFTGKPYYSFAWHKEAPKNDQNHWWFQVGRILDCHNDNAFYQIREAEESAFSDGVTKTKENLFERNFGRLHQAIYRDVAISYYVERDQDYDRVLDIFVRANEAGVSLTKPEIILSMLESKWKNKHARTVIQQTINEANGTVARRNHINLEFLMRACLVLSDLPLRYRVNTFTNEVIARIEQDWVGVRDAVIQTLTLVNKFGITLTGLNVLIPLIQYVYRNPNISFLGNTPFEVTNARLMRRWLILAMLNRIFGRSPEQVLTNLRRIITAQTPGTDFPVAAMNTELTRMGSTIEMDERNIRTFLDSTYQVDFLKMVLFYDDNFWDGVSTQQDHIFPISLFDVRNASFAALPVNKQELFITLANRIANLELLLDRENNEKRAKPFEQWIQTRDISFCQKHLIPTDPALYKLERFDDFIAARETLIADQLKKTV
jgi:hypothetical protein